MKAEIIAVGSELLTPLRTDTNSLFITERLQGLGVEVGGKTIVGDDRDAIRDAVEQALRRADLVILTGGLGPTDDDVTRDGVAAAFGVELHMDEGIVDRIRARFEQRGWRMPDINRRQAMIPEGALVLENPRGTAPGLCFERAGRVVLVLPGPPREMRGMLDSALETHVRPRTGGRRLFRRVLRVTGRTESHTDEALGGVYPEWVSWTPPVAVTILASPGDIALHLTTTADQGSAAEAVLSRAVEDARRHLGPDLYSVDDEPLEAVVGELLRDRGLRIGLAESCTGGLIASRLTDVPGSSDYVVHGVVAYSNEAKRRWLGVPAAVIEMHGAVSEPVAAAMARGMLGTDGVTVGVGVTGIAGPGGGRPGKPVGTVVVAVARDRAGHADIRTRTFAFLGERRLVKSQAARSALDMVRRWLLEEA